MDTKKAKKQVATAAVATAASAGLVLGGLFPAPEDLLEQEENTEEIISLINESDGITESGDGGDIPAEDAEEEDEEKKGYKSIRSAAREGIMKLPYTVRLLICLPLWCIGYVLFGLWSTVCAFAGTAIGGTILHWLGMGLILTAALLGSIKALFPDIPLKKLASKKNIFRFFSTLVLLYTTDAGLIVFWDDYSDVRRLILSCLMLAILGVYTLAFSRKEERKRREAGLAGKASSLAAAEPPKSDEERQQEALHEVLAAVDAYKK